MLGYFYVFDIKLEITIISVSKATRMWNLKAQKVH